MNNDTPSAAPEPSNDEDPRLVALAQAFAQWRAEGPVALPAPWAEGLQETVRHRLRQGAPEGTPPRPATAWQPAQAGEVLAALDALELECLRGLLEAAALDREALVAVHGAFTESRADLLAGSPPMALQEALAARDRQLSIATHELRTPISSILLNLQMLERTAEKGGMLDAATVQRLLAVPARQLRRLIRMVDLLLDAAQVENQRLVLHPQPVDLCELVHEAAGRLAAKAREAGCTLSLQECEPVQGEWDRLRLEQVVTNLLTNAIKYGGGHVEVRTRSGSEAAIIVRDHGDGIAQEDQERIFHPFERLPSTAGEDGAGLGLYIVREIVLAHGGRVEIDSAPGRGATFTVILPT